MRHVFMNVRVQQYVNFQINSRYPVRHATHVSHGFYQGSSRLTWISMRWAFFWPM